MGSVRGEEVGREGRSGILGDMRKGQGWRPRRGPGEEYGRKSRRGSKASVGGPNREDPKDNR